ncbi:unnamed protein product [Onchocerca ochengi]|uniref:ATP-dependent DNA helicase n=1 Tax=Onchocerca ochengi TaxID=42157 RepID=A0A182ET09_ONCOC|nr:unnamed protein product [Onchocerca ochengi]VDM95334.1 unnamed protein product [Onchocerca ochengi]VDM95542.1 unnamed protein product [Onchocerca ochengi]
MRVQLQNDRSTEIFLHQLLEIENRKVPIDLTTGRISLPHNFCNLVTSKEQLVKKNRRASCNVAQYQPVKTLQRHAACSKKINEQYCEATILAEPFTGEDVLIPRIPRIPAICHFNLKFPIRLAFPFTINKAQGQSLKKKILK